MNYEVNVKRVGLIGKFGSHRRGLGWLGWEGGCFLLPIVTYMQGNNNPDTMRAQRVHKPILMMGTLALE